MCVPYICMCEYVLYVCDYCGLIFDCVSLSSIVTFVMHLFAMKPVAYISSLGRCRVVGFRMGAMIEKIESV